MTEMFNLIKSKDFIKLKEKIKESEIDLNIYDEQNNYLIYYIILFNQIDLLKIILDKEIRLDMIDEDGRTLLYNPIKHNNIETLNLLLEKSKDSIGLSLIDLNDKLGSTPLHYCVILNNLECLKILLKYNANPLIRNKEGKNIFELCLKYERDAILYYLLEQDISVDWLSMNNETLLQLTISFNNSKIIDLLLDTKYINLNNQEKQYGLGAIHQSILNNNPSITKKIIEKGGDINLQDYYGNTGLIYSINDKLIDYIELFISNNNLNYNLSNIDGNTALHLILKNYDYYSDKENIMNKMITNTNLNIQDNEGNTILQYLVKNNLLEKYKNILEKKELNIFIKPIKGKTVYEQLKEDELNIIINSYYNYLKMNKEKLTIDWEINCSKDDNIKEVLIDNCKNKIKEIITKDHRSIPKIDETNLVLEEGIFVNTCFYTGALIDILFGLLYLYETFKNDELNIIIDFPLTKNKNLEDNLKSLGINYNYKMDFCNFEIMWIYQNLILPTYFKEELQKKIKNNKYIVIPLGIEIEDKSHANILFYDVDKKQIERFEPNGTNPPKDLNYNNELLDKLIENVFKEIDKDIKLLKPKDYLPIIGFQILENLDNNKCKRIGDPNGFCAIWCVWWIYHKMKNINIESNKLAEILIQELKFKNLNFKTVIRNFSKRISDMRDDFIIKYNLDINDIMVGNYSEDILNKLEKDIINTIN